MLSGKLSGGSVFVYYSKYGRPWQLPDNIWQQNQNCPLLFSKWPRLLIRYSCIIGERKKKRRTRKNIVEWKREADNNWWRKRAPKYSVHTRYILSRESQTKNKLIIYCLLSKMQIVKYKWNPNTVCQLNDCMCFRSRNRHTQSAQ